MIPQKIRRAISLLAPFAAAVCIGLSASSCITASLELGSEYLASDQQFDIFTTTFPLEDISMASADSLSGYSQTRVTVGAIRDKDFGLVKRAAAITLVPIYDTMDFGNSPQFKSFRMRLVADTVSYVNDNDAYIHQALKFYEVSEPLGAQFNINSEIKHGSKMISEGTPIYNGTDENIDISFTKEFGEKYLGITLDDTKDIESYTKRFPGIYIESEDPRGEGGRINMFKVQLQYESSTHMITGNYALLQFTSTYDGVKKDTSFMFYFCPDQMYDVDSLVYNATGDLPQYCLNVASHESADKAGPVTSQIHVEGGGGLKPVLSATEIRNKLIAEISKHGDPSQAAINRASLSLPFVFPDDYRDMDKYPQILSPTCRIKNENGISFASLTDSSDSSADQGDVNRSLLKYAPDITYHTQSLLRLKDLENIHNYDVWLLIMHNETKTTTTSEKEQDEMTDYYNMMMYSQYYNGMYGGYGGYGYGGYGYGGYGGYGNYYSNYYSYYLMQQMYGSSSSTSTTVKTLDIYRYYNAILRGPGDPAGHPTLTVTYALPKTAQ